MNDHFYAMKRVRIERVRRNGGGGKAGAHSLTEEVGFDVPPPSVLAGLEREPRGVAKNGVLRERRADVAARSRCRRAGPRAVDHAHAGHLLRV
jgi:hypothetical protein